MKSLLIVTFILLLSLATVSAFSSYWGSGSLQLQRPLSSEMSRPFSELQSYHKARQLGLEFRPRPDIIKVFPPSGIEVVRPLNIRSRAAREGYTAYYGVERQVIVPWRVVRS